MSAVTNNGSVMTICSSCRQLTIHLETGTYTDESFTQHSTQASVPYLETLVESYVVQNHSLDCAKFNQMPMIS
jgi:hypothetical protein